MSDKMSIFTNRFMSAIIGFGFLSFTGFTQGSETKSEIELIGAITEGTADGLVAKWDGGLATDLPKKDGHHVDPFADETPLFTVNAENYQTHKEYLTPGLIALLETYPKTFYIPVYPSHRTTRYPDWYYDNMRIAKPATLENEGNSITNPVKGINFPQPKTALEVVWNHLTRWRGRFFTRTIGEASVFSNGQKKVIVSRQEVAFETFRDLDPNKPPSPVLVNYSSYITSPSKLAGGALLVIDYVNQFDTKRKAWSFDAEQRRVKRLPHVMYDNASVQTDGLRAADETDVFNGSPDRYNWKLLGRTVKYIPYNNYKFSSADVSYDDLLTPNHTDPKYSRFEAHRVWIVEATLKPGKHHTFKKRRFYIDEDSWSIAMADQYDHSDKIWRVILSYLKHYYEVPMTFTAAAVYHDLKNGNYNVHGLTNEEPNTGIYEDNYPPSSYFRPSNLKTRARY